MKPNQTLLLQNKGITYNIPCVVSISTQQINDNTDSDVFMDHDIVFTKNNIKYQLNDQCVLYSGIPKSIKKLANDINENKGEYWIGHVSDLYNTVSISLKKRFKKVKCALKYVEGKDIYSYGFIIRNIV